MKRSIRLWELYGFATTALGGTLLHFLYEWSGKSKIIALISGVIESTWEHMKLLFVPTFIFALIQSLFFKDRRDFWCVKLRGILLGLALIPIIFYTYNGAIAKSPDWLNITIFFVSTAIMYIFELRLFNSEKLKYCKHPKASLFALLIISLLFACFTFRTPTLNIFKDPITNSFGI